LVQDRPQLVVAQTGPERVTHPADSMLGRADRCAHALQLLLGLDSSGALDRGLRVEEVNAVLTQRERCARVDALDPDRRARPAVFAHELCHLFRPGDLHRLDRVAGSRVAGGDRRANLVDRLELLGEMRTTGELVQHHRPCLRHEEITRGIARVKDLHVPRTRRVADVDGVDQNTASSEYAASCARTRPSR
jgi:hypothetical protein